MSTKHIKKHEFEPIAVVGIGSIYPGALNSTDFWENIKLSRDFIQDILPSHWLIEDYYDPDPNAVDKTYCKRGAFLSTMDFDPMEYGVPPSVLPAIDTAQLISLMVAKQTLQDACGEAYKTLDLSRVSVIIGSSTLEAIQYMSARLQRPIWAKTLREEGLPEADITKICEKMADHYTPLQENTFPGLLQNVIAGRIANRFNLGGTNCVTDAACASSLAALTMSIRELQMGASDMVITGGVDTLNDIVMYMCFAKTQALSLTGDCRPFSDKADGTVLGEGIGMFALKRLEDAEAENDRIYGVIKGIGSSSDGRSKSIYAPVAEGQAKAINRAYEAAGYSLSTVEFLEAHGTGTKAGDLAEFQGIELAFKAAGEKRQKICALGSIKSQIGHTKSAAGAAGLFKALMSLHHKTLAPTIKVDKPNPAFDLEHSPLYLNTILRPWIRNAEHPRRASVSSFGFGGSNYHVTLEEYLPKNGRAARLRTFPSELLLFSAKDTSQLVQHIATYLGNLKDEISLPGLAKETQQASHVQKFARLAIVANTVSDLREKLKQVLSLVQSTPNQALTLKGIYYSPHQSSGKIMFMFPGQGSQYVGMSGDLAMSFDTCISPWDKAADIALDDHMSLQDIVFPVPGFDPQQKQQNEDRLRLTQWAQPALAVTSLVYLQIMKSLNVTPDFVCGHSFGELTALHAAGVMDEETLILLARKRGQLMQDAAKAPGAMLSVFHPVEEVLKTLKTQQLTAVPANFNAPEQIVLSGTVSEIDAAQRYFESQHIRCQRLAVATGFHSALVAPSCDPLRKFLASLSLKSPKLPVFSNVTADIYSSKTKDIQDTLAKQLSQPVLFKDQIEQAYQRGVRTFIEVGPKNVLSGLVGRCLEKQPHHAIHLDQAGENGVHSLWQALGHLFSTGLTMDLSALWSEYDAEIIPTTKAKFTVKINGTNYAKPYPPTVIKSETATKAQVKKLPVESAMPMDVAHSETPIQQTLTEVNDMSNNNNPHLIQMIQNLQMQLINSHNHYQKMMADSHIAFLQSMSQLANQATGDMNENFAMHPPVNGAIAPMKEIETMPMPVPTPTNYTNGTPATYGGNMASHATAPISAPAAPRPIAHAPTPMVAPPPASFVPAAIKPAMPTPAAPASAPQINMSAPMPTAAPVAAPASIPAAPASQGASDDLEKLLLDVVVETTGYPKEMLNMDMSIETDLGIDSIKRVEILSILVERAPHLPQVDPADLGRLQTLGDIVTYMKERS